MANIPNWASRSDGSIVIDSVEVVTTSTPEQYAVGLLLPKGEVVVTLPGARKLLADLQDAVDEASELEAGCIHCGWCNSVACGPQLTNSRRPYNLMYPSKNRGYMVLTMAGDGKNNAGKIDAACKRVREHASEAENQSLYGDITLKAKIQAGKITLVETGFTRREN